MRLDKDLEERYSEMKKNNDDRKLFAGAQTPTTLGAVWMALYLAEIVLSVFGSWTESMCALLMYLQLFFFLAGAFWGYSRWTGKFTEEIVMVDQVAGLIVTVYSEFASAKPEGDEKKDEKKRN